MFLLSYLKIKGSVSLNFLSKEKNIFYLIIILKKLILVLLKRIPHSGSIQFWHVLGPVGIQNLRCLKFSAF